MSMSEIQEAAEIITSAVSPDANIIFGATLKPELEDELIITVIATGFDSAYFHQQAAELEKPGSLNETASPEAIDNAVKDIDMDLTHTDAAEHFAAEPTGDIWAQESKEEDDDDTPAFLRRRKKKQSDES
jgi:cell division protein FtsZ